VCDEAILKATQLFVKYEHGLKLEDKLISQADYAKYFINLSVSCPNLKFKLVSDTSGLPLSEDMSSVVSLLSDGQLSISSQKLKSKASFSLYMQAS